MKKIFAAFILISVFFASVAVAKSDVDKILEAKAKVRVMVNNPDTLVFHEFSTKVTGNTVTLKFTCKNGFGVPETHVMDINVKAE